uniref:Tyrosine decarboxylase/tyrosine decarboxylase / aspartate 1-decarboxylase n=1 Tax=Candidatus Kentrum sp. MB TaxID=2138164 RepID=A0A450X8S4_9GAMM|nr:MAG: tyrosine decarboxylase/tyrosine decarboxylase / aspartate 1-decarboxylase [Candidatus Kentron sp. MB]VFK29640.1 MAG: tyrosine decarboxylase/tyrosine decarboxylase / aspartate 1-decarboxylase [Candidatus Kentron sp. MB]VFK74850.1 MAG: tyrosine decarboxylase/tyrosine decarboxylase / aspartate 1-decarboxylase [Candidatus Kentron sp. MB]
MVTAATPDGYQFPNHSSTDGAVLDTLGSYLSEDQAYLEGRVVNSICSEPHPIGVEAFRRAISSNLGDNRVFPGSTRVERIAVRQIGHLLGNPQACGNLVSGGTEANMLALLAAMGDREPRGELEIVAPESVHYSVEKAAAVLGIRLVKSRMDTRYRADVDHLAQCITERTVAIVATAGTSELGAVDDIAAIADIAAQHALYFHVDAATGGFLIPFAKALGYDLPAFDFALAGVDSITVDPHKYGLAPIPAGCIVFRSEAHRSRVRFASHYVGTHTHTTIGGTRSGAAAAAVYAVLNRLGFEGFVELTRHLFDMRDYLISLLHEEAYSLLIPPQLSIVAVCCKDPMSMLARLEARGWITSLSKRQQALRIVIHHHLKHEHLCRFVSVLTELAAQPEQALT